MKWRVYYRTPWGEVGYDEYVHLVDALDGAEVAEGEGWHLLALVPAPAGTGGTA